MGFHFLANSLISPPTMGVIRVWRNAWGLPKLFLYLHRDFIEEPYPNLNILRTPFGSRAFGSPFQNSTKFPSIHCAWICLTASVQAAALPYANVLYPTSHWSIGSLCLHMRLNGGLKNYAIFCFSSNLSLILGISQERASHPQDVSRVLRLAD